MLAWYRARVRGLAALLLVSLATLGASTAAPHQDDCHDALCVSSVVTHDPAAHSFEGPPAPDEHPLHCIVCHWIRAFKPSIEATSVSAASIPDVVLVHPEFFSTPGTFPAAQPPLRSPPASPAPVFS
jgi:hypothetical protein